MKQINIYEALIIATKETSRVIESYMSQIGGERWWKDCVVAKLSYQQQQRINRDKIDTLDQLDLAALTRVIEKNWYEISDAAGYPQELRTLVREVQSIRNRIAHDTGNERPLSDQYRDFDTLIRYLQILGAPPSDVESLNSQRKVIMAKMAGSSSDTPPPKQKEKTQTAASPNMQSTSGTKTARTGVRLEYLGSKASENEDIEELLKKHTFIGVDFGTSTTTVSRVVIDPNTGALTSEPIPIKQYDLDGSCIEDHLVPTCVAWTGSNLLVGQGASRLKGEYEYGRNIWFSFKMKLGIDLGPQYYRTALPRSSNAQYVIEKPQHAAVVFFTYLREQIDEYISRHKLPASKIFSVSAPASFEANQRKDLCDALEQAGIALPDYGIIDEPNAAFISYLLETLVTGSGIAESIRDRKRNVMVFDFGAGTCDISILEVGATDEVFVSKNKAISLFHALGGDNVDRQIVREVLWPQMFEQSKPSADFTSNEIDNAIIPRLQQAAEHMKIQCCKYISNQWNRRETEPIVKTNTKITGNNLPAFKVRGCDLTLNSPAITLSGFASVMRPFVDPALVDSGVASREDDIVSIFEPIDNALRKAELSPEQLHMVLFIGGSSLNPFVQEAIQNKFGRFVECVIPGDLRTHVSRGAAINSFIVNGLNCHAIRPITSEPVFVVTSGGGLHELVPAGTEMPSGDMFVGDLEVQRDGQEKVELPICVSSADKLLGTIEIKAKSDHPFFRGDTVTLACSLDDNKLLRVRAKVGSQMVDGALLNPLANEALTPAESRMMAARQAVNISAIENKGRPDVAVMLQYAYSCANAERHLEAAEAFEAVERLDMNRNFATSICYHYSRANKQKLSAKWAGIAHERQPSAISAFNLAIGKKVAGDIASFERLMEESIALDPHFAAALECYGHYMKEKGRAEGVKMIEDAFQRLVVEFEGHDLQDGDLPRLRRAATTLGRTDVVKRVDSRSKDASKKDRGYSDSNLVISKKQSMMNGGG